MQNQQINLRSNFALYFVVNFIFELKECVKRRIISQIFAMKLLPLCDLCIEMNIIGMLPPTGNLKPNFKANPSLFRMRRAVNHDINMCVWRSDFVLKKKI